MTWGAEGECMNKLLSALILLLVLSLAISAPAKAYAQSPCQDVSITYVSTTLPATDITYKTAVFNGTYCLIIRIPVLEDAPLQANNGVKPFIFEYGTEPGVYTNRLGAEFVSVNANQVVDGKYLLITQCVTFKGLAESLDPCQTYYVRFGLRGAIPLDEACLEVKLAKEVSFRTTGCSIGAGSHQAGGISAVAPSTRPFIMSNIVVQGATVAAARVSPGEKVDVTATVANTGGSNGASKVTLYINGQEAESKGITLSSGESTQVHFSVSRNDPGTYSIYINGVPAGSFTVDLFTNNDILIYSIIALFTIGIIGVLYLVFKRRPA